LSVTWHCLNHFPRQNNYLLLATIHHMYWQLNRINAYSRKPQTVTCIVSLLLCCDVFWNAHTMVRSALFCAQQHCVATLNVSVCCTAWHRRYILPVARYMHKTQHSAVKCVQSVWAALLFGIETFPQIKCLQLGDRGRFWPNYKVLIFYCYKTNVHILTKIHDNYFLHIYNVYTEFQEEINVRIFIIMWRVRLTIFCSGNQ